MPHWFPINGFANPEALPLLLLLGVYGFWYLRYFRKQRLVIRLSYDPMRLQRPSLDLAWLRVIPRALQLTALALMILALARPQRAEEASRRQSAGTSIMLALDLSGSMETGDLTPSRLEAAKRTAISFVQGRPGDQIGMVLFSSQALGYVPLTLDHDFLVRQIEAVNLNLLPRQGTNLGSAIAMSLNRLREAQQGAQVIILLTDGANNYGEIDPMAAARLARDMGARLYCIGIGAPGEANSISLDEDLLQRMASLTGGRYFRAAHNPSLDAMLLAVSRLETHQLPSEPIRRVEDYYPVLLKIAIVLLLLSFLSMLSFMYNPLEQ